jgi:hypothetical protein
VDERRATDRHQVVTSERREAHAKEVQDLDISRRMHKISPAGIMVEVGGVKARRVLVLVNWTDQGIKNVKQTLQPADSGGELPHKHGLSLEQAYWTVGS